MFSNPFIGPHFSHLFYLSFLFFFFFKNGRFGDPLSKSSGRQNGTHNRQLSKKMFMNVSAGGGFYSRPAFPETIVITVPFRPSVFQKVILFDADWLIFCFFSYPVCYLLHNIFITIFHDTTINAQPLSPPIFEKIAPPFKKQVSSYCGS